MDMSDSPVSFRSLALVRACRSFALLPSCGSSLQVKIMILLCERRSLMSLQRLAQHQRASPNDVSPLPNIWAASLDPFSPRRASTSCTLFAPAQNTKITRSSSAVNPTQRENTNIVEIPTTKSILSQNKDCFLIYRLLFTFFVI